MFLCKRKKKTNVTPKVREESPEVIVARDYLYKTHSTIVRRDSTMATIIGSGPFNYLGSSQNGEYTRYHFCEGSDKRIIYIVLSDEEREKIIQLFEDKSKEKVKNHGGEYFYKDTVTGTFTQGEVRHRFFSTCGIFTASMKDDGDIIFIPSLQELD